MRATEHSDSAQCLILLMLPFQGAIKTLFLIPANNLSNSRRSAKIISILFFFKMMANDKRISLKGKFFPYIDGGNQDSLVSSPARLLVTLAKAARTRSHVLATSFFCLQIFPFLAIVTRVSPIKQCPSKRVISPNVCALLKILSSEYQHVPVA
ncbi:MAG: hypothetical protein AB7E77_04825 [Desulfobulbus sp.]